MSRMAYKYELPPPGGSTCVATLRGEINHVGFDGAGKPCFWVYGDAGSSIERTVMVVGTGWLVDGPWMHRGVYVDPANGFVWHALERVGVAVEEVDA